MCQQLLEQAGNFGEGPPILYTFCSPTYVFYSPTAWLFIPSVGGWTQSK
jgi:hypothetical protein